MHKGDMYICAKTWGLLTQHSGENLLAVKQDIGNSGVLRFLVTECMESNKELTICIPVYLCHMKTPTPHVIFEKNILLIIITRNIGYNIKIIMYGIYLESIDVPKLY